MVEFVMLLPMMLAIIGLLISMSFLLMTKTSLTNDAAVLARACSSQLPPLSTNAEILNCLSSVKSSLMGGTGTAGTFCLTTPTIAYSNTANLNNSNTMSLLTVQLSCPVPWAAFALFLAPSTMKTTVSGSSAMPYLSYH